LKIINIHKENSSNTQDWSSFIVSSVVAGFSADKSTKTDIDIVICGRRSAGRVGLRGFSLGRFEEILFLRMGLEKGK